MQLSRKFESGSIANALLVLVLVLGMLVVSAGTSMFAIRLANQESGQDGAASLAEVAARIAVARLLKDQSLGPGSALDGSAPEIRVLLPSLPEGEGLVTLNPARAVALGIPVSTNNLLSSDAVAGWNGTVGGETASIVAVGRYLGRESRLEVILHVPKFPYVVASTVPIAGDGMTVFGVTDPTALLAGFAVDDALKEPGHVATNDPGTPSLTLSGPTEIFGDARSRGTVSIVAPARVEGERQDQADLVPLPSIDIPADFDPALRPGATVNPLPPDVSAGAPLSGFHKAPGGLAVSGPLAMDGAVIYVVGDVTVDGGLSGNGALVATGDITISGGGGASFTGANGAAVVAGGSLSITGASASARQDFRGLLYTAGNLTTQHVNIAGSVAVNNTSGSGVASVVNSTLVECEALGQVSIPVMLTVQAPPGMVNGPATYHANLGGVGGYGFPGDSDDYLTANMNSPNPDYNNPPPFFEIIQTPTDDPNEPYYQIAMPASRPADVITLGSIRINRFVDGDFTILGPDHTSRASARAALLAADWGGAMQVDQYLDDCESYHWDVGLPGFVEMFNTNAKLLAEAPPAQPGSPGSITVPSFVKLDFSQFYNLAQRIRILSWREV